jgi:eukaryotic-like serine/threonine-protein kinase
VVVHTQGSLLDGRYRVLRHLGSGGMASVLLCEDERLGRQVAVKRLHADSPVDVEQRFTREAKLGALLNHPNLVSVFDTTTDDEGVLIVMEYVEGEPLSKMLRHGPLRPEEVASMVRDLGEALDHAHSQGVVHRDVKPGNVLIREDGVTKLADLGIATASDGTKITRSGTVLGTAAYMAPEQLDGRVAGPPADIYALAAIAFEALSGKKGREGRTPMEIAHQIATEPPPDLREAWPSAPAAVARVLQRGMAREPEDRPASAGEFARELSDALEHRPEETKTTRFVPTEPVLSPGRTAGARRGGRNVTAIVLVVAFLALAAAAIVGAAMSGDDDDGGGASPQAGGAQPAEQGKADKKKTKKAKKEPKEPKEQPAAAPAPPEEPPAGSGDGAALNAQGFELMQDGNYAAAIPILQQAVDSFPEGTGDLNYAYALFNLGRSLRLAGRPDEAIPILEQRLEIPNQTETVQQELDLAKRQAGQS